MIVTVYRPICNVIRMQLHPLPKGSDQPPAIQRRKNFITSPGRRQAFFRACLVGRFSYEMREWTSPGGSRGLECQKMVKTASTGRKRVTRGTQEGFLSFLIRSFQNFFKGLKTCSGWRKHIFDSLSPGGSRGLTKRAGGPIISIEGRCGKRLAPVNGLVQ